MSTAWRKVLRDAWMERWRSLAVVLAIAIGISAFAALLATYAILTRELDRGHLATNPASATLWTDAVDAKLLAALPAELGVGDAEARRKVTGRAKAGGVLAGSAEAHTREWRTLQLFALEDFADVRISRVVPWAGAWPPGEGEILLERDALQVAGVAIGDMLRVEIGNTERELRVVGTVHDAGQAQARMEQIVYAYVALDTLAALGEERRFDQLKLVVAEHPFDEQHVQRVAENVAGWLESHGHPVHYVDVPTPGEHPHAKIMGLLLLVQVSFGLFALLVSGVLVFDLLAAEMAAHVRQIGVMKAIGATTGQVAAIYLGRALLLGAAAVLVSVPIAVAGARGLCLAMAELLNFDIASFAVPWWVGASVLAVGLVVPLLAAALPVWKGSAVSVREALAAFGASRDGFGASSFDRAVAAATRLALPVAFSLRNGFRRRARVALTAATLVMAGVAYLSAFNVRDSFVRTLDRLFETMGYDLTVTLAGQQSLDAIQRAARATDGVLATEGWITTEGALLPNSIATPNATPSTTASSPAGTQHAPEASGGLHGHGGGSRHAGVLSSDRFNVVAVPADTELWKPQMIDGRGFDAQDERSVVVNSALASRLPGVSAGSDLTLEIGPARHAWTVAGIAREPFAGPTAYVPRAYFEAAGHAGVANSVRLRLAATDADSIRRIRADLERNLETQGVDVKSSVTTAERRRGFDEHMEMIYVFLMVVGCVLAVVGGLGLATAMGSSVLERRREMGILRAIGAAPSVVCAIVVAEGAAIAVASGVLAALVAWPVSAALGRGLLLLMLQSEFDFRFDTFGLVSWLAISLSLGALASAIPAWRASRRSIRESLAFE